LLGAGLGFAAEQVFAQGGGFPGAAGFRFGFGAWGCMGEHVRHGARKQQGRGWCKRQGRLVPHRQGWRMKQHHYKVTVVWTGNEGRGTASYGGYSRAHLITALGKPPIEGSSDPAFRGDPARWNPEELLLASLAACHKLWYLHLCAASGICVTAYEDTAEAIMAEAADGSGRFISAILRPRVTVAAGCDLVLAEALHGRAHEMCFIARSMNFPVQHHPVVSAGPGASPGIDAARVSPIIGA
jgi:organic hydroperoxide reductase OsmC/OhrA